MGSRMTGHTIKIRSQDQLQGRSRERERGESGERNRGRSRHPGSRSPHQRAVTRGSCPRLLSQLQGRRWAVSHAGAASRPQEREGRCFGQPGATPVELRRVDARQLDHGDPGPASATAPRRPPPRGTWQGRWDRCGNRSAKRHRTARMPARQAKRPQSAVHARRRPGGSVARRTPCGRRRPSRSRRCCGSRSASRGGCG
jgi:hypothetical protein